MLSKISKKNPAELVARAHQAFVKLPYESNPERVVDELGKILLAMKVRGQGRSSSPWQPRRTAPGECAQPAGGALRRAAALLALCIAVFRRRRTLRRSTLFACRGPPRRRPCLGRTTCRPPRRMR